MGPIAVAVLAKTNLGFQCCRALTALLVAHKASQSPTRNHSHQPSFYCLYRVVCTTSSLLNTHKASQSPQTTLTRSQHSPVLILLLVPRSVYYL